MVDNYLLKENARKQLGNSIFATKWLMVLLVAFIQSALVAVVSSATGGIGSIFISGTLYYGFVRILLSIIRSNAEVELSDLFCGFKENWEQTFILGFLRSLLISLWSLLFVIPGIIKACSYGLATYIQHDSPNKNWKTCLDESAKMMEGHKWQFFCLNLSFIGWYILGSLCFGIGTLFVIPYHETANANFYEALRAEYEN